MLIILLILIEIYYRQILHYIRSREGRKMFKITDANNPGQFLYYSEFPPNPGNLYPITATRSVVAVTSGEKDFQGHSAIWIEEFEGGELPVVVKIHLRANRDRRSETYREVWIEFKVHEIQKTPGNGIDRIENYRYMSWRVDNTKNEQGETKVEKLKRLIKQYSANTHMMRYSKPGGQLAHISTSLRRRRLARDQRESVNCADFAMEVLRYSEIATFKDHVFNRPARIAKGHIKTKNYYAQRQEG